MSRKTAILVGLVLAVAALLLVWKPGSPSRTQDRSSPERGAANTRVTPGEPETESAESAEPMVSGTVSLFGRVLEAGSDEPVPGATVTVYDYEHARTLGTRSDATGAFRIPEAEHARGAFHMVVAHERHARHALRYVRASREPIVVRLGVGGWISGRVIAADGSPVRAYRVSAVRVLFQRQGEWDPHEILYHQILPEEIAVAATREVESADGSFKIGSLAPGKYVLLVVAPGFAPRRENGGDDFDRHQGFAVREGAGSEVEIRLPDTAAYRVLVTDAQTGDRLSGVRFHGTLRVSGRTTLVALPAEAKGKGLYELSTSLSKHEQLDNTHGVVSKEGYASGHLAFGGYDAGSLFRVALGRGGTVRGHVWDGGEPVAGAVLLFERDVDRTVLAAATSEGDGFFEVSRLAAGTDLVCHCYAAGLQRKLATIALRLEDGETRTLEIGAADGTAIQGRVRLRGEPAPNVLVAIYREGARDEEDLVENADREGGFRFDNLKAGRYEVFFNLDSAYLTRFVDLAAGQCLELDVDASRVVRGVLLDAETGRPVTGQPELDIRATRLESEDHAATSPGKDGRFELWIAQPGAYELDCPNEEEFYLRDRPRVDLTKAREVEDVRLFLVRDELDGRITLHVVDRKTGKPIPEGWTRYRSKTWFGMSYWEESKEELGQCAVGRYRIRIGTDEHVSELLEIELTPERKEIERRVALEPADAVRVVRLEHGSAAGRAGVQAGDLILECAGTRIRNLADLHAALEQVKGPFDLVVQREGKPITATLSGKPLGVEIQNVRVGE